MSEKDKKSPRVFSVVKSEGEGWAFSRRDFITLAGMATTGAALACGRAEDPTPQIRLTKAVEATATPQPTSTPEPTAVLLSPEEMEAARRETCGEIFAHETEVNRI